MNKALALAVLIAAAPAAAADQWDLVKERTTRKQWDAVKFKQSGVPKGPLVYYGISAAEFALPDFTTDKPGYLASVPLFEPAYAKPDAKEAKAGVKFKMALTTTPYRFFLKKVEGKTVGDVFCVGTPCEGTVSEEARLSLTDTAAFKALKIADVKPASKVAATLVGDKPAGPAAVEPVKPTALTSFEKAAYQNLLDKPEPAFASCSDDKSVDKCRATLAAGLAAYKSPAGAFLLASEVAYIKARLGDDKAFSEAYTWAKQQGDAKRDAFVARWRKAIESEAGAYGAAADKTVYNPDATNAGISGALKNEAPAPTGLAKDLAILYKSEDPNTQSMRVIMQKLAEATDGGKPPKLLNPDLAKRITAGAAARAAGDNVKATEIAEGLQREVMKSVKDYLSAKDPKTVTTLLKVEKAGLDESLLLQAACTRGMGLAQGAPKKVEKKVKDIDVAKSAKVNTDEFDGRQLVAVSGASDPLALRCGKFFQGQDQTASDALAEKGQQKAGDLKIDVPAPGGKSKEGPEQAANDGKAQDSPSAGDPKMADHVRFGAALGVTLGVMGLFAVLLMGPVGWAVAGGLAVAGFGAGYGLDKLTNK